MGDCQESHLLQLPSYKRVEPGSVDIPLGKFPVSPSSIPTECQQVAQSIIKQFNQALVEKDYASLAGLFLEHGYWRDHLAVSWQLRTVKSPAGIAGFLQEGCRLTRVSIDTSSAFRSPHVSNIDGFGDVKGIEFCIDVETEVGVGRGLVRLAEQQMQWKIFTFFTTLEELCGYEEPLNHRRTPGVAHGGDPNRKNWLEKRQAAQNFEDREPKVLIIGAGQGGLTAAARLNMLNVDTLVIDANTRVGDNWRKRYRQLVLHDPVWYDHMPYLSFPAHWPIFTPKDKLADFFEAYVQLLELNVWTETTLSSPTWDEEKQQWNITLHRRQEDGTLTNRIIHPKHVIQASGHSGKKNFPQMEGIPNFQGDRLCHSSEFTGAKDGRGKKAIVVGSCNSGHDIAQDFYEKGYDITMVQRSSTCVVSSKAIVEIGLKGLYDEDSPPVEDADLWLHGLPMELLKAQQVKVTKQQSEHDREMLSGLEKAGFRLDRGPMDSGLFLKYFQRGGGYYIDVGASQLIIDGKIKIKQGQEIKEVLPHGLRFADGSELEADEIVFATGYQNMKSQAELIFGRAVSDRVDSVWGFNEEGEFRTIWQQSGHPGFWFMGGNLAAARYYSRILALQIKALEEGLMKYGAR
ncbi:FAD/NAD(P)-binding domain-containing protein [Macroventuria anomochaeta]|uniref:FAD/NAD(P)-binding domain-containing protein n=1 Tax=Macroventuria anomochaeta TaxID=301207 RepID=A0ACB6RUI7_9PLEO|nr:FAD/NAD(P)-binding domain-containing protein [Macroventuria anomochaeta]KAF2625670.1 FAD/NAD(P)-binding domain-containing protein [Macroventuria anomochaeta]